MLQILRENRFYFVLALLAILGGLISLLLLGKGELVLLFNSMHTSEGNSFFMIATLMGEYVGIIVSFLLLTLFSTKRNVFIFIFTMVLVLILSQGFKHLVFDQEHRPSYYFDNLEQIDGLTRHKNNSFPSGHTSMAFAMFTVLAISFPRKALQLGFVIAAVITGLSRVYLGQHYLSDIVTGAILGSLVAIVVVYLFNKYRPVLYE